jgi:hypothetical protein
MEYEMCLVYEKDKECPGAGGRKLRHVCIYCPNYQRYLKRKGVDGFERIPMAVSVRGSESVFPAVVNDHKQETEKEG